MAKKSKKSEEKRQLKTEKIDEKRNMILDTLDDLSDFCMDNILSLKPMLGDADDAVAEKIMSFFTEDGIDCRRDETGNVYARVPATDSAKKPVMLSAHMDVVGDDRPVHIWK